MFYKSVRKDSNKAMFEFLTNHFEYDTMNSWNGLRSIANNVKVYNLTNHGLRNDPYEVLEALEDDEYFSINETIRQFEEEYKVEVAFNGRSGGYLVLMSYDHNGHIFREASCSPVHYDNYEYWKEDVRYNYGSLKNYRNELLHQVNLVQAFDKLCDALVAQADLVTDEYLDIKNRTHDITVTKRFESYSYDSIKDRDLHMKYMQECGYTVYQIIEDTMVEYEMNNSETVTVTEDK